MTQTREIDGVLYEVTPFDHERWVKGDYDILYHTNNGVLIELQFFKSIEKYTAVAKEADYPCNVSKPYMQLLKAVKEEYRYVNVYSISAYVLHANGHAYNDLKNSFISRTKLPYQGTTKYTLVNGQVKSAEFIPKEKVEEILKDSDNN